MHDTRHASRCKGGNQSQGTSSFIPHMSLDEFCRFPENWHAKHESAHERLRSRRLHRLQAGKNNLATIKSCSTRFRPAERMPAFHIRTSCCGTRKLRLLQSLYLFICLQSNFSHPQRSHTGRHKTNQQRLMVERTPGFLFHRTKLQRIPAPIRGNNNVLFADLSEHFAQASIYSR